MQKFNKDKQFPLVTIITPAYNREDLIEETIKSILDQKYPNLEYIIIDDGSKDDTYKVMQKYKKQTKIFTQKNIGETRTVNKGFSLAHGEIIAVVSSDDPLLPGSIQTMIEYLLDHPNILAVYPDWIMIDGKSQKVQEVHPIDYNYITMLAQHYCIPGPGTFFRKKAIQLTGGRSLRFKYVADFAFWVKLGMYGPMYHLPETLATFRVHAGGQGIYAKGKEMAQEHKKLVDWIYQDPDLPGEAWSVKKQALASAIFHAGRESTDLKHKYLYYTKSFLLSPRIFLEKIKYELVKLKCKAMHA